MMGSSSTTSRDVNAANVPAVRFQGFTDPWEERKLGDCYNFKNGLNKGKAFFGHGVPIVNFTDVFHRRVLSSRDILGKVDASESEVRSLEVRKGDLFFTRTSETIDEIGMPSVMIDEPNRTVFSGFVLRGRAFEFDPLDDLFKAYVFYTQPFRFEMMAKSTMTTRALTSGTALKQMHFLYPTSRKEQCLIGSLFSRLDELISLHQQKHDRLVAVKASLRDKMFPEPGTTTPALRLVGFTEPWEERKLGDYFCESNEVSQELEILSVSVSRGIYPAAESDRDSKPGASIAHYKVVNKGDVVYNSMRLWQGAVDSSLYEGIVSPAYVVARPNCDCSTRFFARALKRPSMLQAYQRLSQGNSKDTMTLKFEQFAQIIIAAPKSSIEQRAIGALFDNLDSLIQAQQQKVDRLRAVKASLLDKMFV